MVDKKISELPTITQADIASGDWIPVVDSSTNTTKKYNFGDTKVDVTAFFNSTDSYTAGTIVGTLAEGFAYKAVDTATAKTVANAGGQNFKFISGGFVGKEGKKYQVVSCVLRQDSVGSGWYALDDATHSPIGLDAATPVSESGGNIVLNFSFSAAKIGSLVITPDESFSKTKLTFGASVGPTNATISLHHPFFIRVSGNSAVSHTYFGAKGGDWDAVNDNAAGTWTITHPVESHPDATGSAVVIEGYGEDTSTEKFTTTSRVKDSFVVESRQTIHGKTNGATTILSDNVGAFTGSWDGTDTWTITHPPSTSVFDPIVTCVNPQYVAGVQTANATQFTVKFFDVATGAAYTGAGTPTNIYFSRGGDAACAITGITRFKAERTGPCKVDAANVKGLTSNLWVFGIFEIS